MLLQILIDLSVTFSACSRPHGLCGWRGRRATAQCWQQCSNVGALPPSRQGRQGWGGALRAELHHHTASQELLQVCVRKQRNRQVGLAAFYLHQLQQEGEILNLNSNLKTLYFYRDCNLGSSQKPVWVLIKNLTTCPFV